MQLLHQISVKPLEHKVMIMNKNFTSSLFLVLALSFLFSSCTKDDSISGNLHQIQKFSVNAEIDHQNIVFSENSSGTVNRIGHDGVFLFSSGKYFERQTMAFSKNNENVFTISIIGLLDTHFPDDEAIKEMFYEGTYPFGNSSANQLAAGVEIRYTDANGENWTSQGDQSFSHFEITEHVRNKWDNLSGYQTSGTLSCKLYHENGKSILLKNATFTSRSVIFY